MRHQICVRQWLGRWSQWVVAIVVMAMNGPGNAQPSSQPLSHFWRTDGRVLGIHVTNQIAYLAGGFDYVGPANGSAGFLALDTGVPSYDFPKLDGPIVTSLPDGSGGWYLGGRFSVPSLGLSNLVRVTSGRIVDPSFRPNPDSIVRALILNGTNLFVGGDFTRISGGTVSFIAALNPHTGVTNAIPIRANGAVLALHILGDTLYVGGSFTSLNGNARRFAGAFFLRDGSLLNWGNTGIAGGRVGVTTITSAAGVVYVGGDFTSFGGRPRLGLAAVDPVTGIANTWDPSARAVAGGTLLIRSIAIAPSTIFVGGDFGAVGGANRLNVAAVDSATGAAMNWAPNASDTVNFVCVDGDDVIVGGEFTEIGGVFRRGLARINRTSAEVKVWGPQVSNFTKVRGFGGSGFVNSRCFSVVGNQALLGGDFESFGGINQQGMVAIDTRTGTPIAWNPQFDDEVQLVTAGHIGADPVLFVGGTFTNVGGLTRPQVAAVKVSDGMPVAGFNPGLGTNNFSSITAIGFRPGRVYVGGGFLQMGGQNRRFLAELESETGNATFWDPRPFVPANGSSIQAFLISGESLYVGGGFTSIAGSTNRFLSKFQLGIVTNRQVLTNLVITDGVTNRIVSTNITVADSVSAIDLQFKPNPDAAIASLVAARGRLYVGGSFGSIGGQSRDRIAGIDLKTGLEFAPFFPKFELGANTFVRPILSLGSWIYFGGAFNTVESESRKRLAALSPDGNPAKLSPWNPSADGSVFALAVTDDLILAGGSFNRLGVDETEQGGVKVPFFAAFDGKPYFEPGSFKRLTNGDAEMGINFGDTRGQQVEVQVAETLDNPLWIRIKTLTDLGVVNQKFTDVGGGTNLSRYYILVRRQ